MFSPKDFSHFVVGPEEAGYKHKTGLVVRFHRHRDVVEVEKNGKVKKGTLSTAAGKESLGYSLTKLTKLDPLQAILFVEALVNLQETQRVRWGAKARQQKQRDKRAARKGDPQAAQKVKLRELRERLDSYWGTNGN